MIKKESSSEGSDQWQAVSYADWYIKEQQDFDKRFTHFRYSMLKPYLQGPEGLELGPATGEMTRFLLQDFTRLTVVDGAAKFLSCIPDAPILKKVHALFEEFEPDRLYNTIVMGHILDFVEQPVALLQVAKQWLAPGGKILLTIPNGHSIHRLVAVKMGLLSDPCELSARNLAQGQRRVYIIETLRNDLEAAELNVVKIGGVFFKPLTMQQIQDHWTEEMIQGFFELGKDLPPKYAGELYAVCELP